MRTLRILRMLRLLVVSPQTWVLIQALFQIIRDYNFRLRKRKLLLMSYPLPMGLPGGSGYNAENGQRRAACGPHDGKRRHA